MNKLRQEGNKYFIGSDKHFQNGNTFKNETIKKVFDFSYAMAFGDGKHREHRSGGSMNRKKGQIFINTFQGKLSELAIYKRFKVSNSVAYNKLSLPDFDVYGLGEWDDSDIILDDLKFSIKSTKFFGNLLLLETKDWNKKGEYVPNMSLAEKSCLYDYFVLVRIKPDGEKIMRSNKILYSNDIEEEELHSIIVSENWEYDIPGYITSDDLRLIINGNFVIPRGALLNGSTPMDAENYYIQSGDMKDFNSLISNL